MRRPTAYFTSTLAFSPAFVQADGSNPAAIGTLSLQSLECHLIRQQEREDTRLRAGHAAWELHCLLIPSTLLVSSQDCAGIRNSCIYQNELASDAAWEPDVWIASGTRRLVLRTF